MARTTLEILDKSLNKIAEIKNLYPLDNKGVVLRYSRELSDYGECTFRVSSRDPIFTQLGDILQPHINNIRIKRGETTVWSGAIVDNPIRNRNFIESKAHEYEFYLNKVLIRRDPETTAGDGKNNYRTFKTGTMAGAVNTLMTDARTDFGANHPLGPTRLNIGTIENADYPKGFVDKNGVALKGGWNFSDYIQLTFDYHSVYYVLKAFGIYANMDMEIDENLTFNFQKFIGSKTNRLTFEYGTFGNMIDYNIPRLGRRMVNDLWGIGADNDGKILHANQSDAESKQAFGLLQSSAGYSDVKDLNFLKTRMTEELQFTKTPEDAPINVLLNEKAYPFGQYNLGDIVVVKVKDNIIDYNQPRRIVGITVNLHDTGRELITVQTNKPRDTDLS